MSNRYNDFFTYLIQGMDSKMQAQLNYLYSHARTMDEINHRREMEQMKKEITEDVLSRISIRLEDEALKQLKDLLNGLES